MEEIKVSVIVPVYNAEKFIVDCINSVLQQTHKNFELLLVVDGATDGSAEICHMFSEKDSRIVVVEKANEGVSATRNLGIRLASGEYLCFVDADDRITSDYLEKLLSSIINNKAQVALCQYAFERSGTIIPSGEAELPTYDKKVDSLYYKYIRSLYRIDGASYLMGSACRSIFLRNMLVDKGVVFPPCRIYEDQLFLLSAMAVSKKIAVVNEVMYFYNDTVSESAVRKPYKKNLLDDQLVYLENLKQRIGQLPITSEEALSAWRYAILNVRKFLLTNAAMNAECASRKEEINEIHRSRVFAEKVPFQVYRKWFCAQPRKTQVAELLIKMHQYTLLRFLRSR